MRCGWVALLGRELSARMVGGTGQGGGCVGRDAVVSRSCRSRAIGRARCRVTPLVNPTCREAESSANAGAETPGAARSLLGRW